MKTCAYCSQSFVVTPELRVQQCIETHLAHGLSFCSVAHRKAMIEARAPYESRNEPLPDDAGHGALGDGGRGAAAIRAAADGPTPPSPDDDDPDGWGALLSLPPEKAERLRHFFARWVSLPLTTRDTIARRLAGESVSQIARSRGVSPQATSKALYHATTKLPGLRGVIDWGPPGPVGRPHPPRLAGPPGGSEGVPGTATPGK